MIQYLDDGTPLTIGGIIQVNRLNQLLADFWWSNFEPIEDEL